MSTWWWGTTKTLICDGTRASWGPSSTSCMNMGSQLSDSIPLACGQGLEDFTLPAGPGFSAAEWAATPQGRREEEK